MLCSTLSVTGAHASVDTDRPDPDLSVGIDGSGTGGLLTAVRTSSLRSAAVKSAPRILMIGTGVQRNLFPAELQSSISGTSVTDYTDTFGYGTVAASAIFQLMPNATITSLRVRAFDATWTLIDMEALARALTYARTNASRFDAVLLAFPPNAALDPLPDVAGHADYGKYGKGLAMLTEAMLSTTSPTDGPVSGIPASKSLRDKIFAHANLRQRDAVEKYAASALAWRGVVDALGALDAAGVSVIAPAGDYTQKNGDEVVPLVTQTVFGVSALPSVLTVGASYGSSQLSPISGRGPTLGLGLKPDLLAPSDVMVMVPASARLAWPDDSVRVPLQTLDWAKPGVTPSTCPALNRDYRCALQGSSLVSASIVAANVGAMVSSATPHVASARSASDDEVLRGIALAGASRARADAGDREAYSWEQGAGILNGLGSLDLATTPIPLDSTELGQVQWGQSKSKTIDLWSGGAPASAASAQGDGYIGPDATGAAVARPFADADRVSATTDGAHVTVTASGARYQGGVYTGMLTLTPPTGDPLTIPLSLIQDVAVDFHVDYAYNELQSGAEGERVEDQTVVLFPGLPANVGLIGEAFKTLTVPAFSQSGGDPFNGMTIRYGTTKSQFSDSSLPSSEHGRGRIEAVPPGFYRFHLLNDLAVEAEQARGRAESLGIGLGSSGPDAAFAPASNLLVAQPPCSTTGVRGPLDGCPSRSGAEVDPNSGLCVARNSSTQVAYHVYCGEIALAMPTAVVSRAVHLIEHNADTTKSEWTSCGVNVPLDGSALDLAKIVDSAQNCGGKTTPTAWNFGAKSPDCLGPAEQAAHPDGIGTDVDATYSGVSTPGTPGRNLPVGVMTYTFKLPSLNTYTVAGLSLAYKAENAIVGVRFRTGTSATDDSSNGLLVVDGPNMHVSPALPQSSGIRGSVYNEWSVMSANASVGQISLVVIPTAWSRPDLDPTKPIARVQLCDVALRVNTFAKQAWGAAASGVQVASMLDRGLASQIDPSKSRVRAAWNGSSFADAGNEPESLRFAIQVPKDTTFDPSKPHHVRSPRGGPAYLRDARRLASDGSRQESVLPTGTKVYDLRRGVTKTSCHEGSGNAANAEVEAMWETCRLWDQARANNDLLTEIAPATMINGRFAGVLALDAADVKRAAGNVAYENADADDNGATESKWATSNGTYVSRFPVSNFFADELKPFSLSLLSGAIAVTKDASGAPVLTVAAAEPGGSSHTITTALR